MMAYPAAMPFFNWFRFPAVILVVRMLEVKFAK